MGLLSNIAATAAWLSPDQQERGWASLSLSARSMERDWTWVLCVPVLVLVPAHTGPGLPWFCNINTRAQSLGPSPGPWIPTGSLCAGPEQSVQWGPTNSPLFLWLWTAPDKHGSSSQGYIFLGDSLMVTSTKDWELLWKTNIWKLHSSDIWRTSIK